MSRKQDHGTSAHAGRNGIFVDSSAWIASFSARDQHHSEADRLFRRAAGAKRPLFTTNLILAEIHRLLLHRAGTAAAAAALDHIEASPIVKIEFPDASHHRAARDWMRKLSPHPISYADSVSFAVMRSVGCTEAMSFDEHFRLAGFAVCRS